ncbi:unnamed protein product [Prorocentrum cordatum]|uniref:Uncharacterized protein n=1 Tax=Prorocentrum cordatum TaxID=2364126 RepID=A0ABN9XBH8_9DINO|nr:unnamed protein product [Polarella glacialis]
MHRPVLKSQVGEPVPDGDPEGAEEETHEPAPEEKSNLLCDPVAPPTADYATFHALLRRKFHQKVPHLPVKHGYAADGTLRTECFAKCLHKGCQWISCTPTEEKRRQRLFNHHRPARAIRRDIAESAKEKAAISEGQAKAKQKERWEKLNAELEESLKQDAAAAPKAKAKAKGKAKAKAAGKATPKPNAKASGKAGPKAIAKAGAKGMHEDHAEDPRGEEAEYGGDGDGALDRELMEVSKVVRCRIAADGQRQVLVQYTDAAAPDEWIPEDALSTGWKNSLTPCMGAVVAAGLQDIMSFKWVGQKFIATIPGTPEVTRESESKKWRGADKAQAAAIRWC